MPVHLFSYDVGGGGGGGGGGGAGESLSLGGGLTEDHRRRLVDAAVDAQRALACRCFAAAAAEGRFLVLVAWDDGREASVVRRGLFRLLGRSMRREFGGGNWLSTAGSQTRLKNRQQFDHAVKRLAGQALLAWIAGQGILARAAVGQKGVDGDAAAGRRASISEPPSLLAKRPAAA